MKTDKKEPAMTQRTPEEMMNLILSRAENDAHIRVVGMEGSRTNQNIPKDRFQDFDVTYFVDDPALYTEDDTWVNVFGERLIMQKPEDMELFPAVEDGYSFLMFFTDYNKIDLTILPLTALEDYLNGDGLREILLDKDGRVEEKPTPTDKEYHIQKPGARSFDDCCNEFWNITIYVVKGLCRRELLFAIDLLAMMRNELLRMLSWQVGSAYGFTFSVGKNYKFIGQYLPAEQWQAAILAPMVIRKTSFCWAHFIRKPWEKPPCQLGISAILSCGGRFSGNFADSFGERRYFASYSAYISRT